MAQSYVTNSGDTLWSIAERFYGDGSKWTQIYEANRGLIGDNPNTVFAGWNLVIPDTTPTQPPRTYVTVSGDTLWSIAERFYGDGNRWSQLYDTNRGEIGDDPNQLFAGKTLVIPW